jgi:hypothetical protein
LLTKQAFYYINPFWSVYFGDRVLRIICPGWPSTIIFLISASQIARIIDVNHQHSAQKSTLKKR